MMLHNTVYSGKFEFHSKRGSIIQEVPAIVTKDLWNQACQQLIKNLNKPKTKTRFNILWSLIKCGICQSTFVCSSAHYSKHAGQRIYYYKCLGSTTFNQPIKSKRCPAKQIIAEEYEYAIWQAMRALVMNPKTASTRAQHELQIRQLSNSNSVEELSILRRELYQK
jgi:hypothetical protein